MPAVGAMDLVNGVRCVAVLMDHVTRNGEPKLMNRCTMPLTAISCVSRVYVTAIDVVDSTFVLREKVEAIDLKDLQALTEAELVVDRNILVLAHRRCDRF